MSDIGDQKHVEDIEFLLIILKCVKWKKLNNRNTYKFVTIEKKINKNKERKNNHENEKLKIARSFQSRIYLFSFVLEV